MNRLEIENWIETLEARIEMAHNDIFDYESEIEHLYEELRNMPDEEDDES